MKIAIVGFGYWGKIVLNHLMNLKPRLKYLCVVDIDQKKKEEIESLHLDFYSDINQVYNQVDALIICTWEPTHSYIARECLLRKKHVFVEKPLAISFKEADALIKIAQRNNLILMVDQTFLFDKSFLLIKKMLERGDLGRILRIDSFRYSPGIIKPFTNVIVDLFPHDLGIFLSLFKPLKHRPKVIEFFPQRLVNQDYDSALISLDFQLTVTNSYLSWNHPVGKREMVFYGQKGILLWLRENSDVDLLSHFQYQLQKPILVKEEKIIGKKETLTSVLKAFFQRIASGETDPEEIKNLLLGTKILETVLNQS